jgi:malate dehydrogenase (oxaloacetate-decarboxylating)(NADP+)
MQSLLRESGVALNPITDWVKYEELLGRLGNEMVRLITNRAKTEPKRIVFAEADVLKAAQIAFEEEFVLVAKRLLELKEELGFTLI